MGLGFTGCYEALQFFGIPVFSMLSSGSFSYSMLLLGSLGVLFYILVLSGSSVSHLVCSPVVSGVNTVFSGALEVSVLILFTLFHPPKHGGPSRSSNRRYAWLQRTKLHYHLVRRCLRHRQNYHLLGKHVRQHQHWRRRKAK